MVADSIIDALDASDTATWLGEVIGDHSARTSVAELETGQVVGFTRFGPAPDNPCQGHIFALYVAPNVGGRGIGRALLSHALKTLEAQAMQPVTLWVFEANSRARKIYTDAGFLPDGGRQVEEIWGAQQIRLRRDLPNSSSAAHSSLGSTGPEMSEGEHGRA